MKSGSLKLLESSGPLQACNGIALPLPLHLSRVCKLVFISLAKSLQIIFGGPKDSLVSVSFGEHQDKNTKVVVALSGAARGLVVSTVDHGADTGLLISP
jgi:hypothetical protein